MTRTQAIISITVLIVVFLIGIVDYVVSEPLLKLVSAILIGVVIWLIIQGFTNGGGAGRS